MMSFDDGMQASDSQMMTPPTFKRVLVAVDDASQVEHAVELT